MADKQGTCKVCCPDYKNANYFTATYNDEMEMTWECNNCGNVTPRRTHTLSRNADGLTKAQVRVLGEVKEILSGSRHELVSFEANTDEDCTYMVGFLAKTRIPGSTNWVSETTYYGYVKRGGGLKVSIDVPLLKTKDLKGIRQLRRNVY